MKNIHSLLKFYNIDFVKLLVCIILVCNLMLSLVLV